MEYKICKNCLMDSSDPDIKFNESGVCSHCVGYYSKTLPFWKNLLSDKEGLIKLKNYIKKRSSKKVNMIVLLD